jgi:hypothetical protein
MAALLVALAQECCPGGLRSRAPPARGRSAGGDRITRAHAQLQRMALRMARLEARLRAHQLELQVRGQDTPLHIVAP